jgi:hypothetical protein
LEKTGDVSLSDTRTDSKGRKQQAHKPKHIKQTDPYVTAADRAFASSEENKRRQAAAAAAAAANNVDPQESANRRKDDAQIDL